MFALTVTKTKGTKGQYHNELLDKNFFGYFETLQDAHNAVTSIISDIKKNVVNYRVSNYGKFEYWVTETKGNIEYRTALKIQEYCF